MIYVHYTNQLIRLGKVTIKESEGTRKQADTEGKYRVFKIRIKSPITGLERLRGIHEIKVPRFRDNGTGWL